MKTVLVQEQHVRKFAGREVAPQDPNRLKPASVPAVASGREQPQVVSRQCARNQFQSDARVLSSCCSLFIIETGESQILNVNGLTELCALHLTVRTLPISIHRQKCLREPFVLTRATDNLKATRHGNMTMLLVDVIMIQVAVPSMLEK